MYIPETKLNYNPLNNQDDLYMLKLTTKERQGVPMKSIRQTLKSGLAIGAVVLGMQVAARGATAEPLTADIAIHGDKPGVTVSPTLYGIFFEDINYAADGGLYAEMVQNRSFEYYPLLRNGKLEPLTAWVPVERGGRTCKLGIGMQRSLHVNNPTYATLRLAGDAGSAGMANTGYGEGVPVKAGAIYDVSLYARMERGPATPLTVALEATDGTVLASAVLPAPGGEWARQEAVLTASRDELKARLVVTTATAGELYLDMVSLFPRETFRGRRNGLRKDLGEAIAAMQPKVVRFPGGCIVHGSGLDNAYRWKDTVGDVAHRRPNWNRWGYHQSYGLGYFEYMQFCEDIGATPLPILPVGVSCGFNKPYQVANDAALEPWIQDVIDLVEFANGPVDSTWGKVRAAMGHPAPFHLKYIGLGNEEQDTELFRAIFPRFVTALRAKHPEIQIVGTSGLHAGIPLFDLMARTGVDISDEHYYEKPEWYIECLNRFDALPRKTPRVYVGEYASRGNKQFNAVAEAVYLCGIERNADQVVMTSYAPLLARYGFSQWQAANLIWFDATRLVLTPNYHVQQLFASHLGDGTVPTSVTFPAVVAAGKKPPVLAVSPTLSSKDGTLFVKVANPTAEPVTARFTVQGLGVIQPQAQLATLAADKDAANDLQNPERVRPVESTLAVGPAFTLEVPAMAVLVLRVKTAR